MSPFFDPTARGVDSDSAFIDAVASESGLLAEQSQLAGSTVLKLLEQSYGLNGTLVRIPTEKDDTFAFSGGSERLLVKVSGAQEEPGIVNLQTAALRHIATSAPSLPVPRMRRTKSGPALVNNSLPILKAPTTGASF